MSTIAVIHASAERNYPKFPSEPSFFLPLAERVARIKQYFKPRFLYLINELADLPVENPSTALVTDVNEVPQSLNDPRITNAIERALGKPKTEIEVINRTPHEQNVIARVELARLAQPAAQGTKELIEKWLDTQGVIGADVHAIAAQFPDKSRDGIRGRVSEMVKQGRVVATGKHRNKRAVYVTAPFAEEATA